MYEKQFGFSRWFLLSPYFTMHCIPKYLKGIPLLPQQSSLQELLKNLLASKEQHSNNLLMGCLSLLRDICSLYEKDIENLALDAQKVKAFVLEILTEATEVTIGGTLASEEQVYQDDGIRVREITNNNPSPQTFFENKTENLKEKDLCDEESFVEEEIVRIAKEIKDLETKGEIYLDETLTPDQLVEKQEKAGIETEKETVVISSAPNYIEEVEMESVGIEKNVSENTINEQEHEYDETVISKDDLQIANKTSYDYIVERWNTKVDPWFQMALPDTCDAKEKLIMLTYRATALRSNLASASTNVHTFKDLLKRFDRYWKMLRQQAAEDSFEVFPVQFGRIDIPIGRTIYTFRLKAKSKTKTNENILLQAGLKDKENELITPVTLVTLSSVNNLPNDHPDKNLPIHWCAILGELQVLLNHLEIQENVFCAVESVNKGGIQPYSQCKDIIISEVKRRMNALRSVIQNEETIYRIATNYWRVEECFWSIFHGDDRPFGHSFFDRLRKRLQVWRNVIRKEHNIFVKDFSCHSDTLNSINKYVGNAIFQTKPDISQGTILREIRPAVIVKVDKVTRLLKGRVITT